MKEVQRVAEIFASLAATGGSIAKKQILIDNRADDLFREALKFFLDPEVVTGIADKKLAKDCRQVGIRVPSLSALMSFLKNNRSGQDKDIGTVQLFANEADTPAATTFVYDLCRKRFEPSLGVDAKTVNAVWPGFIPEFEVMLADKWQDVPAEFWIGKKFCVQSKLDGHRFCAFKRNGKVTLIARGGKKVEGLVEIEEAVRSLPLDDFVLDGEKLPVGFQNMSNTETFKLTAESTKKGEKSGMCMAVYDFMFTNQWDARKCVAPYWRRAASYRELLSKTNSPFLVPVEDLYVGEDTKEVIRLLGEAKADKKEGVMVKPLDGFYEWTRGSSIVKVKTMEDADLRVVGFKEGTGKHKGKLGSVVVDFNGNEVGVGSGFTDEERERVWADREAYLGRTLEVVYQDVTTDKKTGKPSLRFPVAKCWKD